MVRVGVNVYFCGKRVSLLSKNLKGSEIPEMFCGHWYKGQGNPAFLIMAKSILKGHRMMCQVTHGLVFCLALGDLHQSSAS